TSRSCGVLKTWCSATVSSTVPRFELRWPPVGETFSSTQLRTSSASCLSCSRSRWRSAEGSSGQGSNGAVCALSVAVHDRVGERLQRRRIVQAAARQCRKGIAQQLPGPGARAIQAEQGNIGGLVAGGILAGGLAQGGRIGD